MSKGAGNFDEVSTSLLVAYDAHAAMVLVLGETPETTGCSVSVTPGPMNRPARRAVLETLRRIADAMEAELREEGS